MRKRTRAILMVLAAAVFGPSVAAMHTEVLPSKGQELIYKSGPIPSGIYNLRRQPMAPSSNGSTHRKPRVKSASETVAVVN